MLLFCLASDIFPVEASVDGDTQLLEDRALPGGKGMWRRSGSRGRGAQSGPARHHLSDLEPGTWSSVNEGDEVRLLVFQLWDRRGSPQRQG